VGLGDRLSRWWREAGGERHPDGLDELRVGDAAYDEWDTVQDFGELETARAFRQSLAERGFDAVLTADWPPDEFGRGEITLRVPPGRGIAAEEALDAD
jgi:hypothetical protein